MIGFINDHRQVYGVESICRILPIAPSTYYACAAISKDPKRASKRAQSDEKLKAEIRRVWAENFEIYGVRKVWRQLMREGFKIARCTVARLMKELGIQGIVRGKPIKTTVQDKTIPCPKDKVKRQFRAPAPNRLWVSDFTYCRSWSGFVYVAFVIDTFANRIIGWSVSQTATASFVLEALNQAVHERQPLKGQKLIHHSDKGSQYVSIRYTERLAIADIIPSVGSVGDSYDNALAESIIGLFKTEVIKRRSSWKSMTEVEMQTLKWIDWYNHRRLLEPIGNIPPAEAEANFWRMNNSSAIAA